MRVLLALTPLFLDWFLPSASRADWPQFPFVHVVGEAKVDVIGSTTTCQHSPIA